MQNACIRHLMVNINHIMVPMKYKTTSFLITILFIGMNSSVSAQKLTAIGTGLFNETTAAGAKTPVAVYDDKSPSSNGSVHQLLEYKGELYAIGDFKKAGNITAANIARWNGTTWAPVGTGLDASANALCIYKDELYVAGHFKTAGGIPAKYIAKWDGTKWSAVGNIATYDISALVVYKGELYASGAYSEDENIHANVFKWDGKKWIPLKTKHNNDVFALAVYKDELYAGGTFLKNQNARIMKWDGKGWTDAGIQLSGAVSCFAVHNEKLYAGGYFSQLNNSHAPFMVNFDGKKWHAASNGLGGSIPRHWISSLSSANGKLYAGGKFTTAEETKFAKNFSVLKNDNWSPVVYDLDGSVSAVAIYKNALFIGGNFSFYGDGAASYNIAKIE